ncbi:hypothetical protein CLAIMM_04404 [Cladophialophora immunda]|nr:hypothetical protein CLAIMM_04404 [Cladophialophora immunda]
MVLDQPAQNRPPYNTYCVANENTIPSHSYTTARASQGRAQEPRCYFRAWEYYHLNQKRPVDRLRFYYLFLYESVSTCPYYEGDRRYIDKESLSPLSRVSFSSTRLLDAAARPLAGPTRPLNDLTS